MILTVPFVVPGAALFPDTALLIEKSETVGKSPPWIQSEFQES